MKWRLESPFGASVNGKPRRMSFDQCLSGKQSDNPDKVGRNYPRTTRVSFQQGTTSHKNSDNPNIRMAWTVTRDV